MKLYEILPEFVLLIPLNQGLKLEASKYNYTNATERLFC